MNGMAIMTIVQARHVRRNQFAFRCGEWRFAAQQNFVILNQRSRDFGKRLKNLEQTCIGLERTQITHRRNSVLSAGRRVNNWARVFTSVVGSWQTKFSQTYAVVWFFVGVTLFMNSTCPAKNLCPSPLSAKMRI